VAECVEFVNKNYCRVFVLPDPDDPTRILGFYTLSMSLLLKDLITKSDQRRVVRGLAANFGRPGLSECGCRKADDRGKDQQSPHRHFPFRLQSPLCKRDGGSVNSIPPV
jgi:hypothetical protein